MVTALKDENTLTLVFVVATLLWGVISTMLERKFHWGPWTYRLVLGSGCAIVALFLGWLSHLVKLLQSQFERELYAKVGKPRAGTLKPPSERLETTSIPDNSSRQT